MKSLTSERGQSEKIQKQGETMMQMVIFELGEQVFAADVSSVREIIRLEEVRAIPQTPAALLGVSTIRGEILPVIDLAEFLKIESSLSVDQKKLIILEFGEQGIRTGIAVDNVRRIYNVSEKQLDATLKGTFLGENLICVIKQEGENILMPDFQKIIEAFKLETLRLNQEAAKEACCNLWNKPEDEQ